MCGNKKRFRSDRDVAMAFRAGMCAGLKSVRANTGYLHAIHNDIDVDKNVASQLIEELKMEYDRRKPNNEEYLPWFANRFALVWKSWKAINNDNPETLTDNEEEWKNHIVDECRGYNKHTDRRFAHNWRKVIGKTYKTEITKTDELLNKMYLQILNAMNREDRIKNNNIPPYHAGRPDRTRQNM